MDMEYFTMQMVLNIRVIGKIIWNKDIHFIQTKMEELNWFFSEKIEW
jgi:hypothetical protein